MRHHGLTRPVGIPGNNGVQHGLMLRRQLRKYRRYQVHTLAALFYRRLQDVEETAHGLQQHHVVRGFRNGEMKTNVSLRGEIRIFALRGLETEPDFLFIRGGGPHGSVPGGTGFDGVAGLQNIETVIRIVRQQGFQRLNDVLFRPGLMLPADKRPAATTANQYAFTDQFC